MEGGAVVVKMRVRDEIEEAEQRDNTCTLLGWFVHVTVVNNALDRQICVGRDLHTKWIS